MTRILMVCLGNICRSPLAEGILRQKINEKGLDWEVDSAGTSGYHAGSLPDTRSIGVAKAHGVDILDQRSRPLQDADFSNFDLVYVMDKANLRDVKAMAPTVELAKKVQLIMDLVHPGAHVEVPDPYWNDHGFEGVFQMLDEACSVLVSQAHLSKY